MNAMPNRKQNARGIALDILLQIEKEGAYANLELNKRLRELTLAKLDAAFVTRLVYGVEQNKTYLDHILSQFLQKPPDSLPLPILMILRMGTYQLCLLDKIPAHAAINQAVELVKIKGHSGTTRLVNGVLRNIDRKKTEIEIPQWPEEAEDYLVLTESHPRFLVRRWLNELGPEETLALCRENNQPALFTLRTNTLKISRPEFLAKLQEAGLQASMSPWTEEAVVIQKTVPVMEIPGYQEGWFFVQDASSQLAAYALSPQPGQNVLDLCAAPGGKSTHMAQLMQNAGEIRALDLYAHKVKLIETNARRLGITIIKAQQADARQLPPELIGWADCCLADVPCSGLGVLSRRPDLRWKVTEANIRELALLGRDLLQSAAASVKPGGVLLFSTCTLTAEENQENLAWFLSLHPEFSLEPFTDLLPLTLPANEAAQGPDKGFWQIYPQREHIDGFFMARMRKRA